MAAIDDLLATVEGLEGMLAGLPKLRQQAPTNPQAGKSIIIFGKQAGEVIVYLFMVEQIKREELTAEIWRGIQYTFEKGIKTLAAEYEENLDLLGIRYHVNPLELKINNESTIGYSLVKRADDPDGAVLLTIAVQIARCMFQFGEIPYDMIQPYS